MLNRRKPTDAKPRLSKTNITDTKLTLADSKLTLTDAKPMPTNADREACWLKEAHGM